jgi:hypothetical protein
VFDLLFLVVALVSIVSLLAAAAMAAFGRRSKALRLAGRLAVFLAVYLGVSVTVAFLTPQRVRPVENPWCFDDWCFAVDRMSERRTDQQALYTFDLRIFSRAGRVSQRANGAWIYLIDAQGPRYAPTPAPNEIPLDVLLAPEEVRQTIRTFAMPAGVRPVGLITGHGGGYCGVMKLLIIGNAGCLFGKPSMIGLSR